MNLFSGLQTFIFPNQFTLYALPRPGAATELQICVRTGSIHEEAELGCGLSHFLEHMLFQGCAGFPGRSGTEAVEKIGGSFNAYTSYEHTLYHLRVPQQGVDLGVRLLCSMIQNPELPEKRFAEEQQVILRECDLYFDSASTRLFCQTMASVSNTHPMRIPIIGYRDKIERVTRQMALAYHARRYTPERCFMVAVGNFRFEELCDHVGELTASWKNSSFTEPVFPELYSPVSPRNQEFVFPDSCSRLMVCLPALNISEGIAADLLCGILSGSCASRLPRLLTWERELALDVGASFETIDRFGLPLISVDALPGKLDRAESVLLKELDSIRHGALTKGELEREKMQLTADMLRNWCEPEHIARSIVNGVLVNQDPAAGVQMLEQLKRMTLDDIQLFAGRCLDLDRRIVIRQRAEKKTAKKAAAASENLNLSSQTLDCGTRMICVSQKEPELISFNVLIPAGAIVEKPGERGISNLLSRTLLNGCAGYSEERFGIALDRVGADLSFQAGMNSLSVSLNAPRKSFAGAFTLLTKLLSVPSFPEEPFQRELEQLAEKFQRRAMKPGKAAWCAASHALFAEHPYADGGHGKWEELCRMTPADLHQAWRRFLIPERTLFGFGGAVKVCEAEKWGNELAAALNWNRTGKWELPVPPEFPSKPERMEIPIEREQTVVLKALPSPELYGLSGDLFRLLLLAENGMNSPLFRSVREENALAYSVHAKLAGGFHPGIFGFAAATTPEHIADVEELFDREIERLGTKGISAEEFNTARDTLAFRIAQIADNPHALIETQLLDMHYGEKPDSIFHAAEELKRYRCDEFNAFIAPFFRNRAAVTVVAGKIRG